MGIRAGHWASVHVVHNNSELSRVIFNDLLLSVALSASLHLFTLIRSQFLGTV